MNKEERIYPSMVIRSQAETIELLEKENKQLQNNWNELKEWLEEEYKYIPHSWTKTFQIVLDKMQEIESRK